MERHIKITVATKVVHDVNEKGEAIDTLLMLKRDIEFKLLYVKLFNKTNCNNERGGILT